MKLLTRLFITIFTAGLLLVPGIVYAQTTPAPTTPQSSVKDPLNPVCPTSGAGSTAHVCSSQNNTQIDGSGGIIVKTTRIVAVITGVASIIMIMVGGFKYVISQGESAEINSAKNTILYALVGLVISVSAPFIIGFVINRL